MWFRVLQKETNKMYKVLISACIAILVFSGQAIAEGKDDVINMPFLKASQFPLVGNKSILPFYTHNLDEQLLLYNSEYSHFLVGNYKTLAKVLPEVTDPYIILIFLSQNKDRLVAKDHIKSIDNITTLAIRKDNEGQIQDFPENIKIIHYKTFAELKELLDSVDAAIVSNNECYALTGGPKLTGTGLEGTYAGLKALQAWNDEGETNFDCLAVRKTFVERNEKQVMEIIARHFYNAKNKKYSNTALEFGEFFPNKFASSLYDANSFSDLQNNFLQRNSNSINALSKVENVILHLSDYRNKVGDVSYSKKEFEAEFKYGTDDKSKETFAKQINAMDFSAIPQGTHVRITIESNHDVSSFLVAIVKNSKLIFEHENKHYLAKSEEDKSLENAQELDLSNTEMMLSIYNADEELTLARETYQNAFSVSEYFMVTAEALLKEKLKDHEVVMITTNNGLKKPRIKKPTTKTEARENNFVSVLIETSETTASPKTLSKKEFDKEFSRIQ